MNVTFFAEIKKQSDGVALFDYLNGYFPFMEAVDWNQKLLRGSVKLNGEKAEEVEGASNPKLNLDDRLEFTVVGD